MKGLVVSERVRKGGGDQEKMKSKSTNPANAEKNITNSSESSKTSRLPKLLRPSAIKSSIGAPNCRKDQLQVTLNSLNTNVKGKSIKLSNRNGPLILSPINPVKPTKTAVTGSDVNLKMPAIKKNSAMIPSPKENIQKATCSSNLKDSKIAKPLELNPGGTESTGTSVMKVCPATYCSLNCRKREPKHFLSARRKGMVENKKSIRQKGLASHQQMDLKNAGKEKIKNIVSRKAPSAKIIAKRKEEICNNSSVEIFAEPKEPTFESESSSYEPSIHEELERELSEILKRLSSLESDAESSEEAEVFGGKIDKSGMPEIYSVASFGDDVDESTEICAEEIDAFMNFLRRTDYDPQAEASEENCSCLLSEDYEEWSSECFVVNGQDSKDEELAKRTQNRPAAEVIELKYEHETWPSPGNKNDGASCTVDNGPPCYLGIKSEDDIGLKYEAVASEGSTLKLDCRSFIYEEEKEEKEKEIVAAEEEKLSELYAIYSCNYEIDSSNKEGLLVVPKIADIVRTAEMCGAVTTEGCAPECDVGRSEDDEELYKSYGHSTRNDEASLTDDIQPHRIEKSVEDVQILEEYALLEHENDAGTDFNCKPHEEAEPECVSTSSRCLTLKHFHVEGQQNLAADIESHYNLELGAVINKEYQNDEGEDSISMNSTMVPTSQKEFSKNDQKLTVADHNPARKITEKDLQEEKEGIRRFKPRAPRFLPTKHDPEAEMVNLRYVIMEERKEAAEWMIDHALQQVVTKLAPARKKKVALLVEAFETVRAQVE
ncbi:hypothetical protein ACMD2_13338 [Ananas comosus]|uniref:Calmodulin-binding domain-containing protein n=1 Tax=Ananas comosus TaxID=4615 RepID=A0A199UEI2_ANACO|nr:hypothetical protein ACMD2_13338 [Ananas comosus]